MTVTLAGEWRTRTVPSPWWRPKAHLYGPDPEHAGMVRVRCGGDSTLPEWTRVGVLGDRVCRHCQQIERNQSTPEEKR